MLQGECGTVEALPINYLRWFVFFMSNLLKIVLHVYIWVLVVDVKYIAFDLSGSLFYFHRRIHNHVSYLRWNFVT